MFSIDDATLQYTCTCAISLIAYNEVFTSLTRPVSEVSRGSGCFLSKKTSSSNETSSFLSSFFLHCVHIAVKYRNRAEIGLIEILLCIREYSSLADANHDHDAKGGKQTGEETGETKYYSDCLQRKFMCVRVCA